MFPDGVLCVYSGHLHVPLLDGLLELELLRLLLLVALLAAPLQLLRRELQVEQMLLHAGQRHFFLIVFLRQAFIIYSEKSFNIPAGLQTIPLNN